mmetsp:Transcript_22477/g.40103  ORF Transcript_22477/g.40103 Transcript_22477/m.40103 type:complete len:364 (+) Transcript_22477:4309-5400(+)
MLSLLHGGRPLALCVDLLELCQPLGVGIELCLELLEFLLSFFAQLGSEALSLHKLSCDEHSRNGGRSVGGLRSCFTGLDGSQALLERQGLHTHEPGTLAVGSLGHSCGDNRQLVRGLFQQNLESHALSGLLLRVLQLAQSHQRCPCSVFHLDHLILGQADGSLLLLLDEAHHSVEVLPGLIHGLLSLLHHLLGGTFTLQQHRGLLCPVHVNLCGRKLLQDLMNRLLRRSALHKVLSHRLQRVELGLSLLQLTLQRGEIVGSLELDLLAFKAPGAGLLCVQVDAGLANRLLGLLHGLLGLRHCLPHLVEIVSAGRDHFRCDEGLLHGVLGCVRFRRCLGHDLVEYRHVTGLRSLILLGRISLRF